MKQKLFLLLILIPLLGNKIYSQEDVLRGAYSNKDIRTRASFGIIPDLSFDNIRKLSDLQTEKKIAIGFFFHEEIVLTRQNFLPKKVSSDNLYFKINKFVDSTLKQNLDFNKFILLDSTDMRSLNIVTAKLNSNLKIRNKLITSHIMKKYNVDYVVVLTGGGFPDFIRRTNLSFGAQGLYKSGRLTLVYSGHRMCIFDLRNGKRIRKGYSIQASANFSSLDFKNSLEEYNKFEKKLLKFEIYNRISNNIYETLKLLDINN